MFSIEYPQDAVTFHYGNVRPYILRQLNTACEKDGLENEEKELLEYTTEHLEEIITGTPDVLMRIYNTMVKDYHFSNDKYRTIFEKIFNYDTFVNRSNGAYALTRKLGIKVCPYCNQQYSLTVFDEAQGLIRPELDHFFPKSKYPMFALSFFNLIPSCHICNSNIKRDENLNLEEYIHPYIPHTDEFYFRLFIPEVGKASIRINYDGIHDSEEKRKTENTARFFKLDKIYRHHSSEGEAIYQQFQEFDEEMLEDIYQMVRKNGIVISKKRILERVYAKYQIENPDKEAIGKLRADLYKQVSSLYNAGER